MRGSHPGGLREAVIAALGADVVPRSELMARLAAPPYSRSDVASLDRLLQVDTAFDEVSFGVVYRPAVLEGTSWSVWIDPDDGADGFVRMHPHLAALGWWLIADEVELVSGDGECVGTISTDGWMLDGVDTDVVLGPPGWLDGVLGCWARVDVAGGALRISSLDGLPDPIPAVVDAVRTGFEAAVRSSADSRSDSLSRPPDDRFAGPGAVVDEALVADREAFRRGPIPPIPELLAAAGLVVKDRLVAGPDFDWGALRSWQIANRLRVIGGLDSEQATVAATTLAQFDRGVDNATAAASAAAALDDGAIADAVWNELRGRDLADDEIGRFADRLAAAAPESIGVAWLRARLFDEGDRAVEALALLEATVDDGCRHRPMLVDLAGLLADRGDAAGALALLERAGAGDCAHDDEIDDEAHRLWHEVVGFATMRPRATVGRNDRCPCGSGRKYKACHLGRETHGLDDRAGWLYGKAQRFLRRRYPDVAADLAGGIVDRYERPDHYGELRDTPLVADIALHEDGVFDEFVTARDPLLPDDEALLAAQWALTERALFEIVESRRDRLDLRNLATGEIVSVVNVTPDDRTRRGSVLLGRPLPVGDTFRAFSGFTSVPPRAVERTLEALDDSDGPDALIEAMAAMFAPPRISNSDGDGLRPHTLTWRTADPAGVGTALVAAGWRSDGDDDWRYVRDSTNQRDTIVATARLGGDELRVEVNSAERAAELKRVVGLALADAELVDEAEIESDLPDGAGGESIGPSAPDDPALRAALAGYIMEMERRWLDESIPALGGQTPRQAASDPIGRFELIRLLASFPVPDVDDIGMMNPDRLSAALGLSDLPG